MGREEASQPYMSGNGGRGLACAVIGGFLLLIVLFGRHEWRHAELSPDSAGYQLFATNLVQGRNYAMTPQGPVAVFRTPGYPVFLAMVYRIHGIHADAVLPYQLVLSGLIGAMMVLTGWLLWGTPGIWAGIAAVFLLGMNREAAYSTSQLLSECLATFFLTAGATAAAWAQRGSWRREPLVGLSLSLAILTRPGLLFVGLAYGTILLLRLRETSWRRAGAYAAACALVILPWTAYASWQTGRFIALATNTSTVIVAGLDPVLSARRAGLSAPALDQPSLHAYWNAFPGYAPRSGDVKEALELMPGRWREVFAITVLKLKVATQYLLPTLWACMLIGLALAGGLGGWRGRVSEPLRSVLLLAAMVLLAMVLGWSNPVGAGFLWALPLLVVLLRRRSRFSNTGRSVFPSSSWLLAWYIGFGCMTLVSFGLPRFMRPYLPVFYLCAVAAIPMLVTALLPAASPHPDGARAA